VYWEYDVANDLFLFNDQFYAIFHTTVEQVGGYHLSSDQYAQTFVHPDDLAIVGTEIEKALRSTERHYSRQLEHRILYGDGGVGYISVSINIDRDEQGRILRYYGANQDISERKRVEQQMEETLRETERLYAAVSHESWQAYRRTGKLGGGFLFNQAVIQSADQLWEPEIAQALEKQAMVTTQAGQRAVTVTPLTVRGEPIGALGVYDDPSHPMTSEDLQLIEAVSEQVALAMESARLFDQNQRDAEREHTINRVTSRIRNARSVDEVLTIATQELRLATQASRSVVEILPISDQSTHAGNGEGGKV
jgi:PAS domain S-box-containing protein